MISIQKFTFNPFQENTYVVFNEEKDCLIIDPGNQSPNEDQILFDFIANKGLTPKAVINTHTHLDHIFGNEAVKNAYDIPLYVHEKEKEMYYSAGQIAELYGIPPFEVPKVDVWFTPKDDVFHLGKEVFEILFTPGHSPGEICLFYKEGHQLIAGDVLFRDSIGRTDLPRGDHKTLIQSIKNVLFELPDNVIVYPGHGEDTTIGYEKKNNPFLL